MGQLVIRTLCDPRLELQSPDGSSVTVLGPGKPLALVIYLSLAPHRTASRSRLIDLLWSNLDADRARQTLRQTLSQLRAILGEQAIASRRDNLVLTSDIDVDTRAFMQAVREHRFEDAIGRCERPFLEEFSSPGGEEFDDWASAERHRLHEAYRLAAATVARSRLDSGRPHSALPLARKLRDADPLRQDSWRLLVELLIAAGHEADAYLEAKSLERFLREQIAQPEAATRALLQRLRHENDSGSLPKGAHNDDAAGREREFECLLGVWGNAAVGAAQCATIVGTTGMGKTRLLEDFAHKLLASGALVHRFCPRRRGRWHRFSFAAAIAERLGMEAGALGISAESARTLVSLSASLRPAFGGVADDGPRRKRADTSTVVSALTDLVRAIADEQPVAILIDDLDRADKQSRRLVASLAARLHGERVMLVMTIRSRHHQPLTGATCTTLELEPLDHAQVGSLLSSTASTSDLPERHAIVDALHAGSAGLPLGVMELLRGARSRSLLTIDNGAYQCADPAVLCRFLERGAPAAKHDGRRRTLLAGLAAVIVVVCLAGFELRPHPSRLVVAVAPLTADAGLGFVPPPVIEIRDQYGRLLTTTKDTVHVSMKSGHAMLYGVTSVPVRAGRATFHDVRVLGSTGNEDIQFSSPGLPPAVVSIDDTLHPNLGLFLVRASLDHQSLVPGSRIIRVAPGDSIVGTATVRYDSDWPAASVMLGIVPTWGDHETSYLTVSPLATPARDMIRHIEIRLAAPTEPGCQRLIFVFAAEGDMGQVASGTNWTVGRLLWHHGNDVASWTPAQLSAADSTGIVVAGFLKIINGHLERAMHDVGATTIELDVRGREQPSPRCVRRQMPSESW